MTDTTLLPPVEGDTKRAFLVRNGLAKEGARGRFGKDAVAALAQFPDFAFVEVVPAAKPKVAKTPEQTAQATQNGAERAAAALAKREAKQEAKRQERIAKAEGKPKISQVRADAPSPLLMPKRKQKEGFVVERNTVIAFTTCARADKGGCGKQVQFCACPNGPLAPHYLDEKVRLTPLSLTKPLV